MTEIHLIIVITLGGLFGILTYYIGVSRVNLIREERYLALQLENAMLGAMIMRYFRS